MISFAISFLTGQGRSLGAVWSLNSTRGLWTCHTPHLSHSLSSTGPLVFCQEEQGGCQVVRIGGRCLGSSLLLAQLLSSLPYFWTPSGPPNSRSVYCSKLLKLLRILWPKPDWLFSLQTWGFVAFCLLSLLSFIHPFSCFQNVTTVVFSPTFPYSWGFIF